jgi:predicted phosphodiesterase
VNAKGDPVRLLGMVGDVHTESARLERALAHLRAQGADHLVCTGDIPDGPEGARGVDRACRLLRDANVLTVSGNHERWMQEGEMRTLHEAVMLEELDPESLAYLRSLPPVLELVTPAGLLLLCHGLGRDDMAKVAPHDRGYALSANTALQQLIREGKYRYVINGHSHQPMVRNLDTLCILNAGTLLRNHKPCCALVDFVQHEVVFWELGADLALVESGRFELG